VNKMRPTLAAGSVSSCPRSAQTHAQPAPGMALQSSLLARGGFSGAFGKMAGGGLPDQASSASFA
jgi:hypothetical protein